MVYGLKRKRFRFFLQARVDFVFYGNKIYFRHRFIHIQQSDATCPHKERLVFSVFLQFPEGI
jgi:hypothetical protein